MLTTYDETMTMREARRVYFEVNGFGENGGYDDAWVDFHLGPLPMPFPNTKGRVRAVRFHDLHHVLTGYDTDIHGEFEISAWEIGAGCHGFLAAWQLNLGGLFAGVLVSPRRVLRAFVRGRREKTLYDETLEPLLDRTVGELRASHAQGAEREPAAIDLALFALATAVGGVVALLTAVVFVPVVPFGLLLGALRRRSLVRSAA